MHNTGRDFYYHRRSYQPCRAELLKEMELLGAREVGRDRSIGLKKSEGRAKNKEESDLRWISVLARCLRRCDFSRDSSSSVDSSHRSFFTEGS